MTHDPMCQKTNPAYSEPMYYCECDLIRRVREDEQRTRNTIYQTGVLLGKQDGYRRGVEDAAQAVEAYCIGDTDVDQRYWMLADAIRALVKEDGA